MDRSFTYNLGIRCKVDFVTIVFLHDLHVHVHVYLYMHMYLLVYGLINDAYTHSRMLRAVVASLPCSPPLLQPCHLPAADTDPQVTEIIYYIVRTCI